MPFRGSPSSAQSVVPPLLSLCEQASAAIVAAYAEADPGASPSSGSDGTPRGLLRKKADKSPLTAADLASHDILAAGLAEITPGVPILSEESPPEEVADRRSWSELWMVDPLDGTREFLERTGQFTINIALLRDGRPELGVIFEPLAGRACIGIVGAGAWTMRRAGGDWAQEPLVTRALPRRDLVVLSSHRHRNERLAASLAFLEARFSVERLNSGSALKFCDLAAGVGDVYPRYSACSEWDVAAGDALVTAAGGVVWGMDRQPLLYNARDTLLSPHFLAVGDPDAALWPSLLRELS
ncbi:MAG: inositol monophosphatase family protein [Pseudomonadota bacterium]